MVRLLSALMVICLLHVTTYGAVSELAEITNTSHSAVALSIETQPKILHKSIQDTLSNIHSKISESIQSITSFVTSHKIVLVPLAIVTFVCLYVSSISIIMDFMLGTFPGSSIGPNFEGIYHWLTHPSNHYKVLDYTPDYSQTSDLHKTLVQRDGWKSEIHLPLPESVQAWFNSANNILALASGIVLQYRHNEQPSREALQAFSDAAAAVFDTHSVILTCDMACDLAIGSAPGQDRLSNCHTEKRPTDWGAVTVTADAQLWFLRRGFKFDVAHLLPHTECHTPKYQQLDISPNYGHATPELRTDSRRKLLQADNPLTLPEALKGWLTNAGQWLTLATELTNILRTGGCPNASNTTALNDLTRAIFNAHQAQLTNGTLRCDLDIQAAGVDVVDCTPDPKPDDYDDSTPCSNSSVAVVRDAAIWLMPKDGTATYNTLLLIANHAPRPTALLTLSLKSTNSKSFIPTKTHTPSLVIHSYSASLKFSTSSMTFFLSLTVSPTVTRALPTPAPPSPCNCLCHGPTPRICAFTNPWRCGCCTFPACNPMPCCSE